MSRFRATEVSTPLSLFPFIGVLLSTMGALLVVLIAVSRSARDSALRDVASQRAAAPKAQLPVEENENGRKLRQINDYVARLNDVRAEAERRLRDDQLRLSHVEDHMRRMQDQLVRLKAASSELDAMDEDHLDDRRQAEREVERLRQLITETRATIESLKKTGAVKKRSYAIIPYEGPNRTRRRPIYIECRKDAVVVQPEGIKLTEQDFAPPLDSGNPLAALLRAAREQLVQESGGVAPNKQAEPYPLILIRPDGIEAYYAVRDAIASWDADFGYEFVGDDWKLEFQQANPQLAKVARQAVEQARIRRRVLAAAAPRAFRASGAFTSDGAGSEADDGGTFGGGFGAGAHGGSGNGSGAYASGSGSRTGQSESLGGTPGGPYANAKSTGPRGTAGSGGSSDKNGSSTSNASGVAGATLGAGTSHEGVAGLAGSPGVPTGSPPDEPSDASTGAGGSNGPLTAGLSSSSPGSAPSGAGSSSPPRSGEGQMGSAMGSNMPGMRPSEPHAMPERLTPQDFGQAKSANWALGPKSPAAVPVRRSIQVVVRNDRVALLPEAGEPTSGGREVPLNGPTAKSLHDIVDAVQKHVGEWGMAGQGLYWRPVLVLHVGPDGGRRADELAQLLTDSGIELRTSAAAQPAGSQAPARR
ncbi:MAG: hypothetical protein WD669_05950 [Pirellulales bacterium]